MIGDTEVKLAIRPSPHRGSAAKAEVFPLGIAALARPAPQRGNPQQPPGRESTARSRRLPTLPSLADKHGLVFGELLVRALDAFEAKT
jgi:hypothetical protein